MTRPFPACSFRRVSCWTLCSLPAFDRAIDVLAHVLPGQPAMHAVEGNMHNSNWLGISHFRERVPWSSVQEHYKRDAALYAAVAARGLWVGPRGCARWVAL